MDNYTAIQSLLNEQAELRARINMIPFDGYIEVKEIGGKKYIYARKREGGKKKSVYLDVYSEEKYQILTRQAKECILRKLTAGFAEQNGPDAEPAAA